MAKGRRQGAGGRGGQPRQRAEVAPEKAELAAEEALLEAQIEAEALDEAPVQVDAMTGGTAQQYGRAIADLEAARKTYEVLAKKLQEQLDRTQSDREALNEEREALAADRASHDETEREFADREEALAARAADLDAQADEIARRQADAEAGFLARRDEILGPVTSRIAELTSAWHEQELGLLADWTEKLTERREALDKEHLERIERLQDAEQQLELARISLSKDRAEIERRAAEVDAARSVLEEDESALEAEREQLVARARRAADQELRELELGRERLLERIEDLQQQVRASDELKRTMGADPARVLDDLHAARERVRELERELDTRPGVEVSEELVHARQRLRDAEAERAESLRLQRELQSQLDYMQAQLAEYERLQLSNSALRESIAAYKVEIEEFRAQFAQLHDDRETVTAFPECLDMDKKFSGRAPTAGTSVGDLAQFVEELQVRMAEDKDARAQGKRLNYRLADLRVFVAGLAMSRLHLLEGTSGTGKTTLPNAFANAVGGAARKVEIQAGWRDKQDLLGYYNSFERVYRESPCLQYLYRAGLDFYSDQIILIVLDEMNLSHPEQYFADFLSALEDPRADALISISDRSLPQVPEKMQTKTGVQLRLPPNVWFVGTANQDETTFAFAPKTYDRAHVMELQPNAPSVPAASVPGREGPVSVHSLLDAFRAAEVTHAQDARRAQQFVHDLAPFFNERFRVSWGNRLDQHISRFVPVDLAAGGSLGEALDHLLATKVLKKIQGRHSIRPDALEELAALIEEGWLDRNHGPELTLASIQNEIEELRLG